jgi:hypothetical protein
MCDTRNAYKSFSEKPKKKENVGNVSVDGIII